MATAQEYAAVTTGLSAVQDYSRDRPERDARRAEAKTRQEKAELGLKEYKQNAPLRKTAAELELEQLRMQTKSMHGQSLKKSTYDAFRLYEGDKDVKHLNNFLKDAKVNPMGAKQYGDISRYDRLEDTPETRAMLAQAGYTDPDAVFNDPDVADNFVLATMTDGTRVLGDLTKAYAGTGFNQYMTTQELEVLQKRATLASTLRGSESADSRMITQIMDEEQLTLYEATKRYYEAKHSGKSKGSTIERETEQVLAENPNMPREEAMAMAKQRIEPRTAPAKNLEQAADVSLSLDEIAGGDYFEADINDPSVRRKLGPKITELEKLTGQSLTTEDKRTARNIRSLLALGRTAGTELTSDEAGLLDNTLTRVRKYFTNDIGGVEGTSAYESFRNVFRNALYGASLTQTESAAFQAAAGSLKQKLGPALQQLRVQMSDLKEQMQSIYDLNDERISYYYLGRSNEEIDDALMALDERLELIQDSGKQADVDFSVTPVKGDKPASKPVAVPKSIDDYPWGTVQRGVFK